MGAFGTGGEIDEAFTNLFIGMWVGPLIITLNANLLGAKA
jgi:tetrahydromethanopterin S-methyltransferase subunit B